MQPSRTTGDESAQPSPVAAALAAAFLLDDLPYSWPDAIGDVLLRLLAAGAAGVWLLLNPWRLAVIVAAAFLAGLLGAVAASMRLAAIVSSPHSEVRNHLAEYISRVRHIPGVFSGFAQELARQCLHEAGFACNSSTHGQLRKPSLGRTTIAMKGSGILLATFGAVLGTTFLGQSQSRAAALVDALPMPLSRWDVIAGCLTLWAVMDFVFDAVSSAVFRRFYAPRSLARRGISMKAIDEARVFLLQALASHNHVGKQSQATRILNLRH